VDLRTCHRVLLFGGSFDPPHLAHLKLPLLAMYAIGADALVYIPAAQSPHKKDRPGASALQRVAMLRLMLQDVPKATVLTDEIDRFEASKGEPSYTIDTLTLLRERLGPDVELRLLIGADQLRVFDKWRQPQRIIELAEPVVMVRPPETRASTLAAVPRMFDAKPWEKRLIDLPVMDVSATEIRQRIAEGKTIGGLVHAEVERFIKENGLYRLAVGP
jgi:nicotinate-nucleotide adenylyltransferase